MTKDMSLITKEIVTDITNELQLSTKSVENTLKLILDDCTIPFIARYRKEHTDGLDEVQIRDIRDKFEYLVSLTERKDAIIKSITEQGKLTAELQQKIIFCKSKTELEDIYLPYKPKKRTKAQIAKERGLEAFSLEIFAQNTNITNLVELATPYVGTHEDLKTVEIVMQGVKDFLAEYISEIAEVRGELRQWMWDNAIFSTEVREEFKEKKTKFTDYYSFTEPVKSIAPHRLMAIRRGEKEDILKLTLNFDTSFPLNIIERHVVKYSASNVVKSFLIECISDSYNRIIAPSIETELRLETKNRAEEDAIFVFSKNLRNLLLLPPIPKKVVLGIDPGIRTGSKLVAVDSTGKLLEYATIFPSFEVTADAPRNQGAFDKVIELIKKYNVEYISVGNGTAGRDLEAFVDKVLECRKDIKARLVVVNESGASVYSASDIAREEFPNLDITYRGAVSIARRLQDPLAELVKIDPKSIGVGQYQHDVNQSKLKKSLEEAVESCVNYVGVNLNTASPSLLGYVSGIGPTLAKNIVKHRNENGEILTRDSLLEIAGFGPKTFQQSAGFLRIPESTNPLDNSAVHPEAYTIVERMAGDFNVSVKELIGNKEFLDKIKPEKYITAEIGLMTIEDIVKEMKKPGRDPRTDGVKHTYNKEVKNFEQLAEGQVVTGTVTNVTNFGAFVDIGVHQDGLIHISELSNEFIKNPVEAISVGEQVTVKIIGIDKERKRISLSRKATMLTTTTSQPVVKNNYHGTAPKTSDHKSDSAKDSRGENRRPQSSNRTEKRKEKEQPQETSHATLEDLVSKFRSSRL